MTEFKKQLNTHLQKIATNPYLFIGSGLSRRYLGLPTWMDLLKEFSQTLLLNKPFEYYQSKHHNSPTLLASALADEFHERWWNAKEFKASMEKHTAEAALGPQLPFKIELSKFVSSKAIVNTELKKEIALFKTCIIDGIITTNWDNFLNSSFPDYNVYIGQQQLLFADTYSIGDIYKIHGCCTVSKSIVVTQEDYTDFTSRNAYLAAKLLTIFVEHPIIFLGYSISDHNISEILNSIIKCIDNHHIAKLKDRLIFVEWVPTECVPSIIDSNMFLPDKSVLPIKLIKLHNFTELYEVLANLKTRLPIKVLKKFKDAVYEYVKTNKPTEKIFVGDLTSARDEDIQFVIGVGVASALSEQGYKAITSIDIFEDIILDNKNYDPLRLLKDTISELFKGKIYLPIYKYLAKAGLLDSKGHVLKPDHLSNKIQETVKNNKQENYYPPESYAKKKAEIRRKYANITALIKGEDPMHAVFYIPLLDKSNIDLAEFKKFLRVQIKDESIKKNTNFKKLICLYDFLKYGQPKQ